MKGLRRISFRECYEPPHEGENLPCDEEERYDLDLWFEFETGCLFFCHENNEFYRTAAPPADAVPIPTTPDESDTDCLPECFLGTSLLSLTAEDTPGFVLYFDNGGIIELELDHYYLGTEGPSNPYLCPQFYSPAWLAAEEHAATKAYLDEQMEAASGHNLLEHVPEGPLPPAAETTPQEAEATAPRGSIGDFVNDATPAEREQCHRVLWSGEYVRWATRPLLHRWNNTTLIHFVLGILWTAWCAFVVSKMVEQQPEAATEAANTVFLSTLPFWCVGLWLITSPWRLPRRLRKALYIITNKRTIVMEGGFFSHNVQSWELAKNMVADREELSGDRGRLLFCDRASVHTDSSSVRHGGFLYLGNMARAEKELRRALEARRQRKR